MVIHIQSAPVEALNVLEKSLRLPTADMGGDAMSRGVRPRRIMKPFPIYSADLEDVLFEERGLLRSARLTAWQYVVFVGDRIEALAEVAKGRRLRYASRQSPAVAQTVLDAISRAEMLGAVRKADYELRLLRVPELYLVAVWLHSANEDLLLPVPPMTRALRDGGPFTEKQVVDALKPIAQVRFDTPDA